MNPRQRRGVLLIGLSVVGAVAVFVSVVNYVAEVSAQVGPMVPVLRLVQDASPYVAVTDEMVEQVPVPARWSPGNALQSPLELAGGVPTARLPAGTILQAGMLVEPPDLAAGQRELAILVDARAGVAGKIQRGDRVDIFATIPETQTRAAQASLVVQNARILEVGQVTSQEGEDLDGGFAQDEVVPVTFALSLEETERLIYVGDYATSVQLALRAPGDTTLVGADQGTYQPLDGTIGPVDEVGTASAAGATPPPVGPAPPPGG